MPDPNTRPGTLSRPQKFAATGSSESPVVRAKLIHTFSFPCEEESLAESRAARGHAKQSLHRSSVQRGLSLSGEDERSRVEDEKRGRGSRT